MELDEYDHLNQSNPIRTLIDLDKLAKAIVDANYGTCRFLAALVRARRASSKAPVPDKLADGIEHLIKTGCY